MGYCCEWTGKKFLTGHKVSHSNIKTKQRQQPNLMKKSYFIPELKKSVSLRLSTRAIRTIDKQGGFAKALRQTNPALISPRVAKLRRELAKA